MYVFVSACFLTVFLKEMCSLYISFYLLWSLFKNKIFLMRVNPLIYIYMYIYTYIRIHRYCIFIYCMYVYIYSIYCMYIYNTFLFLFYEHSEKKFSCYTFWYVSDVSFLHCFWFISSMDWSELLWLYIWSYFVICIGESRRTCCYICSEQLFQQLHTVHRTFNGSHKFYICQTCHNVPITLVVEFIKYYYAVQSGNYIELHPMFIEGIVSVNY
jgi:hypothetical protein